nr:MAG TPA: hypothetical protein [Crassvirales sp.]
MVPLCSTRLMACTQWLVIGMSQDQTRHGLYGFFLHLC